MSDYSYETEQAREPEPESEPARVPEPEPDKAAEQEPEPEEDKKDKRSQIDKMRKDFNEMTGYSEAGHDLKMMHNRMEEGFYQLALDIQRDPTATEKQLEWSTSTGNRFLEARAKGITNPTKDDKENKAAYYAFMYKILTIVSGAISIIMLIYFGAVTMI